jgi:hypothetical protein
LFLSWCLRRPIAPVIAQSVCLINEWERMPAIDKTKRRVRAAQATVTRKDLSSRGFALRHVALTEALLGAAESVAAAAE